MYQKGQDRIDKEFDIVNVVQNLRNLTIFLKERLKTDSNMKLLVERSKRNLLMLDSSDQSEDSLNIER